MPRTPNKSLITFFLLGFVSLVLFFGIPYLAQKIYGPPNPILDPLDIFKFSVRLIWYNGQLTQPLDFSNAEQFFSIESGESVASIAYRLEESGLIRSDGPFRDYLIYAGLDTTIQAGTYTLSPSLSIIDVAHALQNATPEEITFVILPGWRMEEIAASLSTSGLNISSDSFLSSAISAPPGWDFLPASTSTEGFLFPDSYILSREISVEDLVQTILRNFSFHLTNDLRERYNQLGFDVYQAVTLASIVQREAVNPDDRELIASVFFNRLSIGMRLDTDPTVQYALGYNISQGTWWTNPLSAEDLKINSPYNTYIYSGLPPGPIANPSLEALQAVAYPAESPYYYFRARCDGSGLHNFAVTFEEHVQNACP